MVQCIHVAAYEKFILFFSYSSFISENTFHTTSYLTLPTTYFV